MKVIYLKFILFMAMLVAVACSPALGLDEKVLVFPPYIEYDNCNTQDITGSWEKMLNLFDKAVLNTTVVSAGECLAAWENDTIRVRLWDMDSATLWGQQLEADLVILSEWKCVNSQWLFEVQYVNPWDGEMIEPAEANSLEAAIRKLAGKRWIYGTNASTDIIDGYSPPSLLHGKKSLHDYLHDNNTYPPDAKIQGVSARVKVRVLVSSSGTPIEVEPPQVNPFDWGFEAVVEQALWALRYNPASVNSTNVNAYFDTVVNIHFSP